MKKLAAGDSFGIQQFFTGQSRNFEIRAVEFTTLLTVKRKEFMTLLSDFPEDYEKFCYIRDAVGL